MNEAARSSGCSATGVVWEAQAGHRGAILRHNAAMDRARARLSDRIEHDDDAPDMASGSSFEDVKAYLAKKWEPFRPLLARVNSRSFRAQGFVKIGDYPGWRFNE